MNDSLAVPLAVWRFGSSFFLSFVALFFRCDLSTYIQASEMSCKFGYFFARTPYTACKYDEKSNETNNSTLLHIKHKVGSMIGHNFGRSP